MLKDFPASLIKVTPFTSRAPRRPFSPCVKTDDLLQLLSFKGKNQAVPQKDSAFAVLAWFLAPEAAAGAGGAARKGAGILDVPNVNVDHVRMCADPCHSTREHRNRGRNRGENTSNTKIFVFLLAGGELLDVVWILAKWAGTPRQSQAMSEI